MNGTPIRIVTDEGMDHMFQSAAHFLTYQGVHLRLHQVRDLCVRILKEQQRASSERYPEFDAVGIWRPRGCHDLQQQAPAARRG